MFYCGEAMLSASPIRETALSAKRTALPVASGDLKKRLSVGRADGEIPAELSDNRISHFGKILICGRSFKKFQKDKDRMKNRAQKATKTSKISAAKSLIFTPSSTKIIFK